MYLACFSPFEVMDVDSLLGGGNKALPLASERVKKCKDWLLKFERERPTKILMNRTAHIYLIL